MTSDRKPREQETREAVERPKAWKPATTLPDPGERVGFVHRWIRTSSAGQQDPVNVSQAQREGWVPVEAAEYPELQILSDHQTRWPTGIEVGGLLLCKCDIRLMKERSQYYRTMVENQMRGVNSQLDAEEDPRLRTIFRQHSSIARFGPDARREQLMELRGRTR